MPSSASKRQASAGVAAYSASTSASASVDNTETTPPPSPPSAQQIELNPDLPDKSTSPVVDGASTPASVASSPAPKKKKKKKGSRGKAASSASQNLNSSSGTPGLSKMEIVLENSLLSATEALKLYKQRINILTGTNATLNEQVQSHEQDAIEIMRELREQCDQKDAEISRQQKLVEAEKQFREQEKKKAVAPLEKQIQDLNNALVEKDCAIRVLEEEVTAVKDFKKKRTELLGEIQAKKAQIEDLNKIFKETIVRVERKFLEEKVRMQKETSMRISDLAAKAHKEAVTTLTETTREIFRENLRLTEALKAHLAASEDLEKSNKRLAAENSELKSERETSRILVRDKIITNRQLASSITQLQEKIATLENALSHSVREFDIEREALRKCAFSEIEAIKRVAAILKLNLDKKTNEMLHIKKLAHYVLEQRTKVERFFMEALDCVQKEIEREKVILRKEEINSSVPLTEAAKRARLRKETTVKVAKRESVGVNEKGAEFEILSWTDKQRVLRALFARMNGLLGPENLKAAHPTTSSADKVALDGLSSIYP